MLGQSTVIPQMEVNITGQAIAEKNVCTEFDENRSNNRDRKNNHVNKVLKKHSNCGFGDDYWYSFHGPRSESYDNGETFRYGNSSMIKCPQ